MPASDTQVPSPPTRRSRSVRWLGLAAILMAAVAGTGLWFGAHREPPPVPPPPEPTERWPVGVRTIAGSGIPGFIDGSSAAARFADPFGIAVDAQGGVFVSDAGDTHAIRRIDPDGRVSTLCGGREGFDDGDAKTATFRTPSGVALLRDGRLAVADTGNNAIRLVGRDGSVTTLAGDGTAGSDDGQGRAARFNGPIGVAAAADGSIYVADTYNDRIRRVDAEGRVSTVAGGPGTGYRDGPAADALFDTPSGISVAEDGAILVADTGNSLVRRIADGQVATLPAAFDTGGSRGWAHPVAVAASGPYVYVTDADRVSVVEPGGSVRILAGSYAGSASGAGADARFNAPSGVAVDAHGVAYVADSASCLVRRLTPPGRDVVPFDLDLEHAPVLTPDSLRLPSLPWPVDEQGEWHEVTATFGEARGSRGGGGYERLHSGIDVKGDIGIVVRAVRDEAVARPVSTGTFDAMNEWLRVGAICYVHVRVGRYRSGRTIDASRFSPVRDADGHLVRMRVKRGTRFHVGDPVGTINRQAHVHLEVGPQGAEVNPLAFPLPGFTDTEPPVIVPHGITVFDESGAKLAARGRGRLVVSGRVSIVVDAYDRVGGNAPYRRLGVYAAGYQVLDDRLAPAPGFASPLETIEFDRSVSDPDAPGLAYSMGSGITAYGSRITRFRYVVTNTVGHGEATAGSWDTTTLPPGNYVIRVTVRDHAGNASSQDLEVTVERPKS